MVLAWRSSQLRTEEDVYRERWYSEIGQTDVQRTLGGRSEPVRRQSNASYRNHPGREGRKGIEEAHVKGHRGVNKHCFDGLSPIWHQWGPGWGFYWGGSDPQVKSVTDVIFWVGAEGGKSLSLSRRWFNLGCQIQNPKRKTGARFNN